MKNNIAKLLVDEQAYKPCKVNKYRFCPNFVPSNSRKLYCSNKCKRYVADQNPNRKRYKKIYFEKYRMEHKEIMYQMSSDWHKLHPNYNKDYWHNIQKFK